MMTEMKNKIAEIKHKSSRDTGTRGNHLCHLYSISGTIFAQISDLEARISIPSKARGIIPSEAR